MKDISTKQITEELCVREGISNIVVEPHSEITITTGGNNEKFTGPAIIMINQD
ncbi:BC1881 family protein [Aquibacillus saliphilus]|uniref:BC1881 family protein n=1 Tax=Aquibacillus saliphilus TaxID=1909422 RepID=UPI001CF016BD|nr:BC1881 family protein [Aquibacillus saliphilus]